MINKSKLVFKSLSSSLYILIKRRPILIPIIFLVIIFFAMPMTEYVPISAEEQNKIDKAEELRIAENRKTCEANGLVYMQESKYSKGSCITKLELVKRLNESIADLKEIEKDKVNSNLK